MTYQSLEVNGSSMKAKNVEAEDSNDRGNESEEYISKDAIQLIL